MERTRGARPVEVASRQIGDEVALDLRRLRVAGGGAHKLGIAFLQFGDPMQPKRVARRVGHAVGGVLAPREPAHSQVFDQLRLSQAQQRPVQVAGDGPHAADALRARAARQVHQHRLGLVVHVVREGDGIRADFALDAPERLVAQPTRGRFQALARALCLGGHVHADGVQRDIQPRAKRLAERGVRGALGPDGVVHMGGEQRQAVFLARIRQHRRQRHGVRAAGQRDQHALAAQGREVRRQGVGSDRHTILHHIKHHYNRFEKIVQPIFSGKRHK